MNRLIIIILITHINVSYASFPFADTLKVNHDTLQTDKIKRYHSSLIEMGIDLNDCKCVSCRNSIAPLIINLEDNKLLKKNSVQQSGAAGLYILSGIILLGAVIWSVIGLTRVYNCVDNRSNCPQSSGKKPKSGAPIELLLISVLILIGIGIAIKARFIQLRNKRNILKNK